jgi:hypothetical protein
LSLLEDEEPELPDLLDLDVLDLPLVLVVVPAFEVVPVLALDEVEPELLVPEVLLLLSVDEVEDAEGWLVLDPVDPDPDCEPDDEPELPVLLLDKDEPDEPDVLPDRLPDD